MALSVSVDRVDETGRELLTYGTSDFPVAFFEDDLTKMTIPYHWHEETEIVVITNGTVQARIAGQEFALKKGEGYFANSGILHRETLISEEGSQHALVFHPRVIALPEDLAWKMYLVRVFGNPQVPFLHLRNSVPWQREMLRLAETAWNHGAYEKSYYPLTVRDCLGRACALIADHLEEMEQESACTDAYRRDELRIKKILLFIERNYDASVTIEDLAVCANISVSTCLRLFRTVLGVTPIQYVIQYRVRKAAEALAARDGRTVSEIAHASGFSDASYFNRCFRKEYGVTPTRYLAEHLPA